MEANVLEFNVYHLAIGRGLSDTKSGPCLFLLNNNNNNKINTHHQFYYYQTKVGATDKFVFLPNNHHTCTYLIHYYVFGGHQLKSVFFHSRFLYPVYI